MDAQLVALAAGGASALVGAMVTDAWAQAKEHTLGLWRRHRPQQAEAVEGELDAAHAELTSAAAAEAGKLQRARLEGRWQGRLERLLEEAAEAAADVRRTTDLLAGLAAASASQSVVQHVTAGRDAYTSGRDLTVGVTRRDGNPDG